MIVRRVGVNLDATLKDTDAMEPWIVMILGRGCDSEFRLAFVCVCAMFHHTVMSMCVYMCVRVCQDTRRLRARTVSQWPYTVQYRTSGPRHHGVTCHVHVSVPLVSTWSCISRMCPQPGQVARIAAYASEGQTDRCVCRLFTFSGEGHEHGVTFSSNVTSRQSGEGRGTARGRATTTTATSHEGRVQGARWCRSYEDK